MKYIRIYVSIEKMEIMSSPYLDFNLDKIKYLSINKDGDIEIGFNDETGYTIEAEEYCRIDFF